MQHRVQPFTTDVPDGRFGLETICHTAIGRAISVYDDVRESRTASPGHLTFRWRQHCSNELRYAPVEVVNVQASVDTVDLVSDGEEFVGSEFVEAHRLRHDCPRADHR